MRVTIPCDLFWRLSHVAKMAKDDFGYLRSIGIHRINGNLVAIGCDRFFAAIELFGTQDGPDDFMFVALHDEIINQCVTERQFGGTLTIERNDMLQYIHVTSFFGYIHNRNAGIFLTEPNPVLLWRDWLLEDDLRKSNGNINFRAEGLEALARSSPSGKIILPKNSDVTKPVTVQDVRSTNWIGVFVPNEREENYDFRKLEKWCKDDNETD